MKYNDIYILRNKDFKSLITVFQEIEPPLFCKKSGGGAQFYSTRYILYKYT